MAATTASSPSLGLDFDNSKSSSYIETMDGPFYLDQSIDYGYTNSPAFGVPIGLPPAGSPQIGFNSLSLPAAMSEYTYSSPSFAAPPPARPFTPADGASISPPTLSYNLSGGELSSDSLPSGRHSRGSGTLSPPNNYSAAVPRSSHRYNPIATPPTRASTRAAAQRKRSRSQVESDEEDDEFQPNQVSNTADSRRETIRKQRIESEQRRRDELRDGYARLKETLPASNQKSSKVSLLDRATGHLRYLETVKEQLEMRLKSAEAEVHRLRNVNEALMLSTARHAVANSNALASTNAF